MEGFDYLRIELMIDMVQRLWRYLPIIPAFQEKTAICGELRLQGFVFKHTADRIRKDMRAIGNEDIRPRAEPEFPSPPQLSY